MKAISLWNPWATAMEFRLKTNETRSWPTSYRGDLVICSAKRKSEEVPGLRKYFPHVFFMAKGCALCVVELYDCVTVGVYLNAVRGSGRAMETVMERDFGDYSAGRFVWLTRNHRKLTRPVPIRGKQGLWTLAPDIEALIKEQL